MRNINYKSDFALIQRLYYNDYKNDEIKDFGFPPYDFRLYYYTVNRSQSYVAGCRYDRDGRAICTNCRNENGKIMVLFNNHGLNQGDLKVEIEIDIPNDLYQDGFQKEFLPYPTKVKLWNGPTDGYGPAEAKAILPYIKGEAFKFEDFTPEQLAEITDKAAEKAIDDASQKIQDIIDGKSSELDESFEKKKEEIEGKIAEMEGITDEEIEEMWKDD